MIVKTIKKEEPAPPSDPSDNDLLVEIRDLLKNNGQSSYVKWELFF